MGRRVWEFLKILAFIVGFPLVVVWAVWGLAKEEAAAQEARRAAERDLKEVERMRQEGDANGLKRDILRRVGK